MGTSRVDPSRGRGPAAPVPRGGAGWRARLALLAALLAAGAARGQSAPQVPPAPGPPAHEFYFTRAIYQGEQSGWGSRWSVDYPKADQQFLVALRRLSVVDAYPSEHPVRLEAPELRDYPFLYMLEVGSLTLSEVQARALREYLLAGGFLVIDDFWGSWAWKNLEEQMAKVFPDHPLVEVPLDHPVFHAFYDIGEILQVPNVYQANTGVTWELDGRIPHVRGIFDDEGRLMVLVNWNTDLGDAWEWADLAEYPLRYSTYAFEMGVNFVVYAMSY